MGIGIQVKDVFKSLGINLALNGVSMNFEEGLMHGIIGPEGAGKTTLIRSMLKLLTPNKGEITYSLDGKLIMMEEIRESVAYMPQQQSLYADLSIDEHLQFFKDLYSIPKSDYEKKKT